MSPSIPQENFQEVGPHVKKPPKSHYNAQFHRNFIGFVATQSFVPKDHIGTPVFFYCSSGSPCKRAVLYRGKK
jgi:hypothetical protein